MQMSRINVWKTSLAMLAISLALTAQRVPDQAAFEVVSIKPADPAAPGHMTQQTRGGFRGRNLRLFELIMSAWHLNRDQLVGGPPWMETAGWDIDARFPAGMSAAQAPQMMQSMLTDRFALVVHRETRTLPVYDLIVAKSGIKFREGDGRGEMSAGPRLIRYGSGTMAELARQLSSRDRPNRPDGTVHDQLVVRSGRSRCRRRRCGPGFRAVNFSSPPGAGWAET